MPPELRDAIDACRLELTSSSRHEVSFAARRRLLRALGPQMLDERGFGIQLTPGKRRRVALALTVASRVAPAWARDIGGGQVEELLSLVRGYLEGTTSLELVRARTDALQGGLANNPEGKDEAYLAGCAAAATGWVAQGDELLSPYAGLTQEELDDPQDPDQWDPAFLAAASWAAGGMPWAPNSDRARYREFWLWYLDDAVPAAWALSL